MGLIDKFFYKRKKGVFEIIEVIPILSGIFQTKAYSSYLPVAIYGKVLEGSIKNTSLTKLSFLNYLRVYAIYSENFYKSLKIKEGTSKSTIIIPKGEINKKAGNKIIVTQSGSPMPNTPQIEETFRGQKVCLVIRYQSSKLNDLKKGMKLEFSSL